MSEPEPLTWTCHVCGRERPDSRVGVARHKRIDALGVEIGNNVRYCLDDEECTSVAMRNDHALLRVRACKEQIDALCDEMEGLRSRLKMGMISMLLLGIPIGVAICSLVVGVS